MARPHVLLVPYPSAGHINPALQLAKLLHRHGIHVTFVNTARNHRRAQAAGGAGAVRGREGFQFETIPDGLPESGRDDDINALNRAMSRLCAAPLRELILRLNGTAGVPPVTCVLPTALMSFALKVARELGIPTMVQWGSGTASLSGRMMFRELRERGYLPLKDESYLTNGHLDTTIIDWIPGIPPISLGDICSSVRITDPDDFNFHFRERETQNCTKAGALILNTFDDLDADVLTALRDDYPRIYSIGPLGSLVRHELNDDDVDSAGGLSMWKQDTGCFEWLDTQEPSSVVYVNFGSLTVLTTGQLAEFAWGLADTGHPILWVIRENLVSGPTTLPPEFVAETVGRCRLAAWCAQEEVLRHPAVGCFLTHNGWNSTCESIAAGVPMVCWPGFADQYTNSKYVCEVWGVGLRLDAAVRKEQVAGHVRKAMEADGMRRSAARRKAKAEAAARPGWSSYENLQYSLNQSEP